MSRMTDQTIKLQQMMNESGGKAKVIAVTSGKGGVGKTNISANLGLCLAAARKKVLLVDADFSLGNLDVLLNISSNYNISHLVNGSRKIEEVIHSSPYNVDILCGGSGLEDIADITEFQRQRLLSELNKLQDDNDFILIDTAAGISKSVVGFCLSSDSVLVVTTPEATSMTDAYAMIKVLANNDYRGKISLIVNMAENVSEGKKVYQQISRVASKFLNQNIYDAGVFLRDQKLLSAIRQRKPVVLAYPKAGITTNFVSLASRMFRSDSRDMKDSGFFRKVVDWFF